MDCKQMQELIPLMQQGLLTGEESVAVQQHLADCPDCRRMEDLESRITDALDGMFSTLQEPAVPVPTAKRHSLFSRSPVRTGWVVAAVVVLAFVLSLVLRENPIDVQPVMVQSPVRDVRVMHAEYRAPVVREAGDMAVKVDQLKKNIVWVSIQN